MTPRRPSASAGLVDGWLESPPAGGVRRGAGAQAELPFVLGLGETVVRGQIDLLVPAAGGRGPDRDRL